MRVVVMVGFAVLSAATAWGQVAIWTTSAGGNGHAYEFVNDGLWAAWSSNSQGAISTFASNISVTYSGELNGFDYPAWTPTSTYADGFYVTSAPPANSPAIRLYGGDNSVKTITFSEPVLNPVLAIWSLGNALEEARFAFDQTPTLVSTGPSIEYGGPALSVSEKMVSGVEGDGTLMFPGTYSQISWTNPNYEYRYGFTVGIAGGTSLLIDVADGSVPQEQAGHPLLSGAKNIDKTGAGTLVLDRVNSLAGTIVVRAGAVQIAHASALREGGLSPLAGGTVTLPAGLHATIGRLAPSEGGVIDVGNGTITVRSDLSNVALSAAIVNGIRTGTSGIISSDAALTQGMRTVGWLDNGDGSVTFGFAAIGDGNLDGMVDIMDVAYLLTSGKYGKNLPATWRDGDYNYDGILDILDIADSLSTRLYNTGYYTSPPGGIEVVPEPSPWLMAVGGLAFAAWARWRRRIF